MTETTITYALSVGDVVQVRTEGEADWHPTPGTIGEVRAKGYGSDDSERHVRVDWPNSVGAAPYAWRNSLVSDDARSYWVTEFAEGVNFAERGQAQQVRAYPVLAEWERELLDASPNSDAEVFGSDAEVAALRAEVARGVAEVSRLRERLNTETEQHRRNVVIIAEGIKQEAENRDYCSEFEDAVHDLAQHVRTYGDLFEETASRTPRERDYEIEWTHTSSGTVTVRSTSEDDAVDAFNDSPEDYVSRYDLRDNGSYEVDDVSEQ